MAISTYTVASHGGRWRLTGPQILRCDFHNKADLVQHARMLALACQPSRLRIKSRDGRMQAEHEYPRCSDPRRKKD